MGASEFGSQVYPPPSFLHYDGRGMKVISVLLEPQVQLSKMVVK